MNMSRVLWRTVNWFKGKEVRAGSPHTSNLGRQWMSHDPLLNVMYVNIMAKFLANEILKPEGEGGWRQWNDGARKISGYSGRVLMYTLNEILDKNRERCKGDLHLRHFLGWCVLKTIREEDGEKDYPFHMAQLIHITERTRKGNEFSDEDISFAADWISGFYPKTMHKDLLADIESCGSPDTLLFASLVRAQLFGLSRSM